MVVYGYLMYLAAKSLSYGSKHLPEILGPGFVGGLELPILGALPEALLILSAHLVNHFKNKKQIWEKLGSFGIRVQIHIFSF